MAASVECAVCLSVVDEGEKVRQLPACGHVFHQECINMWLSSHASCPVCHGKAAPADELADAIAVCISVTRDVVVPASLPPPSSPAAGLKKRREKREEEEKKREEKKMCS